MISPLFHHIEAYVTKMMSGAHEKEWPFHNIHHVRQVVEKCTEVARANELDQQMIDELTVAAWFHDIGYFDGAAGHELRSSRMCIAFLNVYELEPTFLHNVADLILSTRYPGNPATIQEKIICDADLYHLAANNYTYWADRLLNEINRHQHDAMSKQAWLEENVVFFQNHSYYTGYAQTHWTPQKLKNLATLKQEAHIIERGV